ncbi:acyl-CoA N-acyltransferase [Paraphoma chrysanthemicola]|uniref:Acyl-CoA N-acyltransferase n=1 Tax=Paraphoma chrysanthemicola TaxID=798071 RepID=A0A8K0VW36_9PLEO|nr:acyl-CoA N-acyltransferase [Paraphoma chrysanthemicola]
MATPFVRPYDKSRDFDGGLHVFFTTIDHGLDWEPARTIGSYLWYKAYVSLTPDTCFVLDDGDGHVVGYCIGTPDTTLFAERWRNVFAPIVDPVLVPDPEVQSDNPLMERDDVKGFRHAVYNGSCSMLQSWPDLLQRYPAHMHIDLLPEYQRKGHGTALINAFFEAAKTRGANGVHLDMVKHNVTGRAFYDRIGFQICPQVMDGGVSGRTGENGIVVTLVKVLA